jgi:hypothetical protein
METAFQMMALDDDPGTAVVDLQASILGTESRFELRELLHTPGGFLD